MKLGTWGAAPALVAGIALAIAGCGQSEKKGGQAENKPEPVANKKAHDHSGEWCDEHGVWESVCTRCHPELVAKFKEKGDWCKQHKRPDSQCFICHPEKEAEFAAEYEAKYGKKPPKPDA